MITDVNTKNHETDHENSFEQETSIAIENARHPVPAVQTRLENQQLKSVEEKPHRRRRRRLAGW